MVSISDIRYLKMNATNTNCATPQEQKCSEADDITTEHVIANRPARMFFSVFIEVGRFYPMSLLPQTTLMVKIFDLHQAHQTDSSNFYIVDITR